MTPKRTLPAVVLVSSLVLATRAGAKGCAGDLSNDGQVNSADLSGLLGSWGACQVIVPGCATLIKAEWEFAYRAGTQAPFHNGSTDDGTAGSIAWYYANSSGQTRVAGGRAPNALEFHGMLGNVWEWVNDRWGNFTTGAQTDPTGPASGTARVVRGGAWNNDTDYVRSSYRGYGGPSLSLSSTGFRVARNP